MTPAFAFKRRFHGKMPSPRNAAVLSADLGVEGTATGRLKATLVKSACRSVARGAPGFLSVALMAIIGLGLLLADARPVFALAQTPFIINNTPTAFGIDGSGNIIIPIATGDILIADSNGIVQLAPIKTGIKGLNFSAHDSHGNTYFASSNGTFVRYTAKDEFSQKTDPYLQTANNLSTMSVDNDGNIYYSAGGGIIRKFSYTKGTDVQVYSTGYTQVVSITYVTAGPKAGILYVADAATNTLNQIAPDGSVLLSISVPQPGLMTSDPSGNIYIVSGYVAGTPTAYLWHIDSGNNILVYPDISVALAAMIQLFATNSGDIIGLSDGGSDSLVGDYANPLYIVSQITVGCVTNSSACESNQIAAFFMNATGIAASPNGELILDGSAGTLPTASSATLILTASSSERFYDGSCPTADSNNNFYEVLVSTSGPTSVIKSDEYGNPLGKWTFANPTYPGTYYTVACTIAATSAGDVYVPLYYNGAFSGLFVLHTAGKEKGVFTQLGFKMPVTPTTPFILQVDSHDILYFGLRGGKSIYEVRDKGTFVNRLYGYETDSLQAFVFDKLDNIFGLDNGNVVAYFPTKNGAFQQNVISEGVTLQATGPGMPMAAGPNGLIYLVEQNGIYTTTARPIISEISPDTGGIGGGSAVTITGKNLGTNPVVTFGANAAKVVSASQTKLVVTSPAGAAGVVDVHISTSFGNSVVTTSDKFTYFDRPTVTKIAPDNGPARGGTEVTIAGTAFTKAKAVHFGGKPATSFKIKSATEIIAVSPPGTAGTVDIIVVGDNPSLATASDKFTYTPAPLVEAVSPDVGPNSGGTRVTITGVRFSGATKVDFGTKPGLDLVVVDATTIKVTSPAQTAGAVDVIVTQLGQPSAPTKLDTFTYLSAPVVKSVSPDIGVSSGGTEVKITGTNLTHVLGVKFGTKAAASFKSVSSTEITAVTPSGTAGEVDVIVDTVGGLSAAHNADHFTYIGPPVISKITPNVGPSLGGVSVTVTGTNLAGAKSLHFGTVAASIRSKTATQILTTAPANAVGLVDVTATNSVATSARTTADRFLYKTELLTREILHGFSKLTALTVDGGRNIYVALGSSGPVLKYPYSNGAWGAPVTVASQLPLVGGLTVDGAGVVYVGVKPNGIAQGTNGIARIAPSGNGGYNVATRISTGGFLAAGLAVDSSGDLYLSDKAQGMVAVVPLVAGSYQSPIMIASGLATPGSLAVASDGSVIVANIGAKSVVEIPYSSGSYGTMQTVTTAFAAPAALTIDRLQNLYVADAKTGVVARIPSSAGTYLPPVTLADGFTAAAGLGVDNNLDVMIADNATGGIWEVEAGTVPATPVITAMSPVFGSVNGGGSVTIVGRHLANALAVAFGGATSPEIVSNTDTSMTVIVPANSSGLVNVYVTTVGGSSPAVAAGSYTYE